MTVKLNEQMRANIRLALIHQKFDARKKAAVAGQSQLALDIYNDVFTKAEQDAMNALPTGWLPEVKTIRARFSGSDFGAAIPGDKRVRVPVSRYGHGEMSGFIKVYGTAEPLILRYREYANELSTIERETGVLKEQINGVLKSVTTANKLVSIWPEIKPIVDRVVGQYVPTGNLPAVQVKDLNKALGLAA